MFNSADATIADTARDSDVSAPSTDLEDATRRIVERTIDDMRPRFQRDGGNIELIKIEKATVYVRMTGACSGCQLVSLSVAGVQSRLTDALQRPVRVVPVPTGH